MERIPNQTYTLEFKEEAVKMAMSGEKSIKKTAEKLGIPDSTLTHWVRKYKKTGKISLKTPISPPSDLEAENTRLRKELAEAKMERDILKKATAFFARESGRGTRS